MQAFFVFTYIDINKRRSNDLRGGTYLRKWVLGVTGIVIIGGVVLYIWSGTLINHDTLSKADGRNDYAILLGAKVKANGKPSLALQYRIDEAISYLQQYPHVKIIVSGGQGEDEPMSEAELMYTYLVEAGIEKNRILIEDVSTSTYENLLYSKKLLPKGVKNITVISSDFHLARASYIADKLNLEMDVVAAKTPTIVEKKLRTRERLAMMKTLVVGK